MVKKNGKHSLKSRQTETKILLTTLSLAATLGGWQVFSGQAAKNTSFAQADQSFAQSSVEAAPLPTLIPPLSEQTSSGLPALSSSKQPNRLFLGGAKPQSPRPAPVSRTGSSR